MTRYGLRRGRNGEMCRQMNGGRRRRRRGVFSVGLLLISGLLVGFGCGCSLSPASDGIVTLLTYNVQNLFDATDNGTEYPEFDPGTGEWDIALYHAKLYNIAEAVRRSCRDCPDLVALQEVENQRVLEDLGEMYLQSCGYRYLVSCSAEGSAITVGFLSRLPVTGYRTHRTALAGAARVRDIMELRLELGNRVLYVFNNHWKSKSGGAEPTEGLRLLSASVIAARVSEILRVDPEADVVVAGDLNERIDEYTQTGRVYRTALMPFSTECESWPRDTPWPSGFPGLDGNLLLVTGEHDRAGLSAGDRCNPLQPLTTPAEVVVLHSPWLDDRMSTEGGIPGSYAYKGEWERIDHFLLSPGLFDRSGFTVERFDVIAPEFLLDKEGYPKRWRSYTGTGYSDHLPLLLTLRVR